MAEYKYRALGWQDDDIASLNVIDGTSADNQVELQITKQGEGGTIKGPAIKGADGITIDATDPNTVKISGSGLVQKDTRNTGLRRAYTVNETGKEQIMMPINVDAIPNNIYSLVRRDGNVSVHGLVPDSPTDTVLLNKKYVDDNYVKKIENTSAFDKVYTVKKATQEQSFAYVDTDGSIILGSLPVYVGAEVGETEPSGSGRLVCYTPVQPWQTANKKYVDNAVAAGGATVDGTSIVKDTDGKIQLNQEYIDYLDNQLYQPPAISVFTMLDAAGAALPTSNELGTTLSAAAFNHQETNIKNIQGDNVELHINNAAAATISAAKKDVATKVTLTTAQSITSSTKFTLKGTNTKGAAFSRDYQVSFYRYAYTAITDATTAPTSGATQQAAVSTFASNGSTFNYTKGGYIYFYTDNTGKKVQTNVLGQWADVDTTDMGKVTLTQNNGATHEYTCYRIGPFIETGSAKYRV